MNDSAKRIIAVVIAFVLGVAACYAAMSWVLKERVGEYNGIIDDMEAKNKELTSGLGRVQTEINHTAERVETAASGVGDVADGLDPVINGIDEIIRILGELTGFFDAVEAIIGGLGSPVSN